MTKRKKVSTPKPDTAEGDKARSDVSEWVKTLVGPLHALLVAGPKATGAMESYNKSVLGLIVRGLRNVRNVPDIINLIYANMASAVAPQVGAIASKEASEEEAAKRRDSANKKMYDAGGPFWRICAIIESDGATGITSLLEEASGKNASLGKLNTWTKDRIDALAFDPIRGLTPCHYTLRDGVEVLFTVGDATIAWDHYQAEVAHTKALHEEHSKEWSAVRRQYRIENPAGMPDGRTKKERDSDTVSAARAEARADRAIVARITEPGFLTEEQDAILARDPVEATT